jgi:hypothetical protein
VYTYPGELTLATQTLTKGIPMKKKTKIIGYVTRYYERDENGQLAFREYKTPHLSHHHAAIRAKHGGNTYSRDVEAGPTGFGMEFLEFVKGTTFCPRHSANEKEAKVQYEARRKARVEAAKVAATALANSRI